jgi:hypothetical protein
MYNAFANERKLKNKIDAEKKQYPAKNMGKNMFELSIHIIRRLTSFVTVNLLKIYLKKIIRFPALFHTKNEGVCTKKMLREFI